MYATSLIQAATLPQPLPGVAVGDVELLVGLGTGTVEPVLKDELLLDVVVIWVLALVELPLDIVVVDEADDGGLAPLSEHALTTTCKTNQQKGHFK